MRVRNTQHTVVATRVQPFVLEAGRLNATAADNTRAQRERQRGGLATTYRVGKHR